MANQEWMNDPRIRDIDKSKLSFLQKLVFEIQQLSEQEKLPFLMALASSAKKQSISFTPGEVKTITEVIKDYSTPAEITKMNKILSMFQRT